MKIKTLIVDDEPIALEKLQKYCDRTPLLELVGSCDNGIEALSFLAQNDVDLIITDINMPDLNGIEFVKSLSGKPMIIFTTAYSEYAIDGFKVSAVDYLLKPYSFAEFSLAINKAIELYLSRLQSPDNRLPEPESLFVKIDHRFIRISLASILYIKGYGEYLQIFTDDKDSPVVTLSSFAAIKERLTPNFTQIHRSYIVNMNRVEMVDRNRVFIDRNTELPVGESFKADLQLYLSTH
ncbi:MAG: response regulator transcription factor [Muribaculaceae bacterium]|nr:response regulator transcription factor [Muribaculaceae bacterium]